MTATLLEADSGFGSEEDFQATGDLTCNCELCQARMYVSMKQNLEDDFFYYINNQSSMGDVFHQPPHPLNFNPYQQQMTNQMILNSNQYQEMQSTPCASFGKCGCCQDNSVIGEDSMNTGNFIDPSGRLSVRSLGHEFDPEMYPYMSSCPQVYASKDGVMHIRLSNYVALEYSGSAYRLINYRNNSTIALSDNGKYGFLYHYNCRGLLNMHHGKLSIVFDKDRQILLRNGKPSFVRKENEFYRMTEHFWTACRSVSMENFDKDKTPEILKKVGCYKACDEAKLKDLINSSVMHVENGGLVIYLGDAKIEQKVNGDVQLNWFYEDRANCMIVSPLAGTFSLSTKNLEIITTPKADIYISFNDFFVHVGNQQMTVSNGSVTGRCTSNDTNAPSMLSFNGTNVPPEFSPNNFLPMYNSHPQPGGRGGSGPRRHDRSTEIYKSDEKDFEFYEFDFKSDTESVKS